jgi:hypothetical protein
MAITEQTVGQARDLLEREVQADHVTGWGLWDGSQPGDRVRCLSSEDSERFAVACSTFRVNQMGSSGAHWAIGGNQNIRSVPTPSVILLFCSSGFTDEVLESVRGGDLSVPMILLSRAAGNSIEVPAFDRRVLACDWDLAVAFHRAAEESLFGECRRPLGGFPAAESAAPTEADEAVEPDTEGENEPVASDGDGSDRPDHRPEAQRRHDGSGAALRVEPDLPNQRTAPADEEADLLTAWRRAYGDRRKRRNLEGTRDRLVQRLAAGRFADDFTRAGGEINVTSIISFLQTDHPDGVGQEPERVTKNTHGSRINDSRALLSHPEFSHVAEPGRDRDAAFHFGTSLGLLIRHIVDAHPLPSSDAVPQHDATELSEWVFRGGGVKRLELPSWLDSAWLAAAFEEALRD